MTAPFAAAGGLRKPKVGLLTLRCAASYTDWFIAVLGDEPAPTTGAALNNAAAAAAAAIEAMEDVDDAYVLCLMHGSQ